MALLSVEAAAAVKTSHSRTKRQRGVVNCSLHRRPTAQLILGLPGEEAKAATQVVNKAVPTNPH